MLKPAFGVLLVTVIPAGCLRRTAPGLPRPLLPFQQNAPTAGNEEQLAIQFFQSRDFENAAEIFEKLYDKKPSNYYYTYYLYCLLELKDYDKAEKLIKTQRKNDNDAPKYMVDLGYVSFREGDAEKATKYYEEAIKKLQPDQQQIFDLANAFLPGAKMKMPSGFTKRGGSCSITAIHSVLRLPRSMNGWEISTGPLKNTST